MVFFNNFRGKKLINWLKGLHFIFGELQITEKIDLDLNLHIKNYSDKEILDLRV